MYIMYARSSDTKEQIVGFVSRLYLDWYHDIKALIIHWKKRHEHDEICHGKKQNSIL